jgi:hypothetical protein
MAAGGSRARADYDYLIKLLLIGDSGMCNVPLEPGKLNPGFSM